MNSIQPPSPDIASGMTAYATATGRRSGRLRTSREDFQVDEILDLGQVEQERKEGYVPVYSVRKNGVDTPHAADELAVSLKSKVNFAGLKDSNAVTVQYASARSSRADDPPVVHGRMFEAERIGYLPRPISRGMMTGNRFRIVVRTEEDISGSVEQVFRACNERRIPNFFGYQRFGLRGMVNARVGGAILRRDFRGAVQLFLGETRGGESADAQEARRLAGEGRYRDARGLFSFGQDIERRVARRLEEKPDDYLGAIRRIPIVPRRLFVQAYQSYIFNRTASDAVSSGLDLSRGEPGDNWTTLASDQLRPTKTHGVKEPLVGETIPLIQIVGYGSRNYGSRFDRLMILILKEESVEPSRFYIKEAEELSNEGGFRQAPLLAKDLTQESRQGSTILSFALGKGEYATTLLREVLKPEDPRLSGF
jgi:tRNA pseudouridine13 synthase